MAFPARFQDLPDHPFPRLRRLLDACPPGSVPGGPAVPIVGEPTHPMPPVVAEVLAEGVGGFAAQVEDGRAAIRRALLH